MQTVFSDSESTNTSRPREHAAIATVHSFSQAAEIVQNLEHLGISRGSLTIHGVDMQSETVSTEFCGTKAPLQRTLLVGAITGSVTSTTVVAVLGTAGWLNPLVSLASIFAIATFTGLAIGAASSAISNSGSTLSHPHLIAERFEIIASSPQVAIKAKYLLSK